MHAHRSCVFIVPSQVLNKIKSIRHPSARFGLTLDMWTDVAQRPFGAMLTHFIDDDWKMIDVCLGIKFMPG
jgi:hypothetical protein